MSGGYIEIEIEPAHITGTGQRYRVFHEGEIIIDSAREPLCESARFFAGAGIFEGEILMRRRGREQIDMSGNILSLIGLTVSEGQASPPRFAAWVPFDRDIEAENLKNS